MDKTNFHTVSTYYFRFKGEVNTDTVIDVSLDRCVELGVNTVVVASETGRSALKILRRISDKSLDINLVVVTHPPDKTWGPRGEIPIGLGHPKYRAVRECLESNGAIIIQSVRPFASASRSLGWDKAVPDVFIDYLLGGLFGQGVKIAIEAALMATDAGAVNRGEVIVSMGGTFKGLDASLLVKTTYSYYFLKEFEVLEIIAKPWRPRISLPEYKDPDWKGDLDKYYEEPSC